MVPSCLRQKRYRLQSNCIDEERNGDGGDATTPQPGTTHRNGLHAAAPVCTNMHCKKRRGPSRIRTGDGGFAIRCLDFPTLVVPNELGQPNNIEVPTVVPTSLRGYSQLHLSPELAKIIAVW